MIMMFVPWLSPSERRFVGTWTMTGTGDPNPVDVVVRSDRIMVLTFSSGDTAKYHWEIVDDKLRVTQMDPVWRVIKKQIEATFLGRKPFTHQTDSFTWGENGDGGFCFENNMRTSFDWTPDVD